MTQLNHPKVKNLTPEIACHIGLSPNLQNFIFSNNKPTCFDYYVEEIEHSWTYYIPDTIDIAFALWSCNGDQTLACLSDGQLSFYDGFHDEPEITYLSKSEQGLLFRLFLTIYETDVTEDRIVQAAQFASFNHMLELQKWHSQHCDSPTFEIELSRMVKIIDAQYAK